ncbi:CheR family methyltransferase [Gemmata sp. JC717]|uniref:CheR family methyltransferase n=1 Tax=Gemmata algarum TaxID=2975278 RepID=UPI0021BAC337|nr:CheR family methyltransferase [Gemmata algarum]MDY3551717.1 CheR family methyltransferase [Gemmata algarum]
MSGAIERTVRDRLGVDPSTLGTGALDRAVQVRMTARGIDEPALYTARLLTEPAERDALAAVLSVSETWFFRGGRALFDRLAGFAARRAHRSAAGVRVLSAPCSTGEEPYSLAIALLEQLGGAGAYTVDAIDVSEPNLTRASAGRYPAGSFREPGPDVRPPYFRKVGDRWEVLPHIRAAVRFFSANLTDPVFLAAERPYDLILCRNVFIYFTPEAKQRAVANLDRLLALDGRLCLTPAEADRLPPGRFSPDGPPEFGIYRRAGSPSDVHATLPAAPPAPPRPPSKAPAPPLAVPAPGTLAAARALADAGRLGDARAVCEALLRTAPGDADALALLGVVQLATGNTDAAYDAFGKALYLDPDHREAVTHMITLCERRGQTARADALRKRLAKHRAGEDQ